MQIEDYNIFSKFLHRLVLGNKFILNSLFDLEFFLYEKKIKSIATNNEKYVFISGLARSGTTLLLRSLYETNAFASLTYNDMPFVLSPNLWSKINRVKISKNFKYASQNPKIKVNINSPEAFEEVFWKIFSGKNYSSENSVNILEYQEEIFDKYKNFIKLVLKKYEKKLYLSKNNNNILRLKGIREFFPNSLIIVPYRDPLQQSFSLLTQHKYFSDLNKKNIFSKDYMDYLGHYEFGLNHKNFNIPNEFLSNHQYKSDTHSIDYWLAEWGKVYSHALELNTKYSLNIIFIEYEKFCSNPSYFISLILKKLNLKNEKFEKLSISKAEKVDIDIDDKILKEKIYSIYNNLNKFKIEN